MAAGYIIATRWFRPAPPWTWVGAVAAEGEARDWDAYIGTYQMMDLDPERSARLIIERGAKLDEATALCLMPELADCGVEYRRET